MSKRPTASVSRLDPRVDAVADGSASAARAASLEGEARHDPELNRQLLQARALVRGLQSLPLDEPEVDLVTRARRAWSVERRYERPARLGVWLGLGAAAAVAAALVVVLLRPAVTPGGDGPSALLVAERVDGAAWASGPQGRRDLVVGDVLLPGTQIGTEPGAAIALRLGSVRVSLDGDTEVGLLAVEAAPRAALMLDRGRLTASAGLDGGEPAADGAALEVRVRGALHWLRLRQGTASVLHAGDGRATVAALAGSVSVAGALELQAGQSVALWPERLGVPGPLPEALALQLQPVRPAASPAVGSLEIEGETTPGARVQVDGRTVAVDASGRFTATVALGGAGAAQPVVVEALDVLGRRRVSTLARLLPRIEPPPRAPARARPRGAPPAPAVDTEWGWVEPG